MPSFSKLPILLSEPFKKAASQILADLEEIYDFPLVDFPNPAEQEKPDQKARRESVIRD